MPRCGSRARPTSSRNLTALAQAAVGFDTSRGDVVTVEDLAFDGNRPEPPAAVPEQMLNSAENSPMLVKYLALLVGLLVVVAFAVRPAIRHAGTALATRAPVKAASRELAAAAASQAALSAPEPAPIDPERLRTQEIFEQVTRPPEARAHAELAAVAELDSLGIGHCGKRRCRKGIRLAEQGIESEAARRRPGANLSGVRKAAILLVAVGEELAKEVLRALPETDVQQITEELADLRGITPELSAEVLEEFWQLLDTQNFMVHGGLDYASRVLIEAFGKQRADDLLALMRRSQEAAQGNLAKLQRTDPQQLGKLLDSEHPQTIALVLAHLDPEARLDGAGQPERGAQGGLHPAAGGDAPVFSGDGAEGGADSAPASGERGRHGAPQLLRLQGRGGSAEPAQRRGGEEDSGDHRREPAGTGAEHPQPDVHLRGSDHRAARPPFARLFPAWTSGNWRWPCAAPTRNCARRSSRP